MGTSLDHVMIVGGGPSEWSTATPARWGALVERLGRCVAAAGGRWLTVRPYGGEPPGEPTSRDGGEPTAERWSVVTADGRCVVIVDATANGQVGFARSVRVIPGRSAIDEKLIAEALYAPADCEPDVILIFGPRERLPPSLVWELAYGELVYTERPFAALGEGDLAAAIDVYTTRDRRFGGLSPL